MSARSRALIPPSAEQQAAMQAVAVTEQRRRQGRTLSAWPYASAFFRCLNGSRRISLTDLRFFCSCADEGGISWQPSPVAGCRG